MQVGGHDKLHNVSLPQVYLVATLDLLAGERTVGQSL